MCSEEKIKKANSDNETLLVNGQLCTDYTYKHVIVWKNVAAFVILHIFSAFGLYTFVTGSLSYKTLLWFLLLYFLVGESVTGGAHRYYTHKCYKASPILQAYFLLFFVMAGQNSILIWVRDHRLHHRYSDTDGDPHNSNRGFFFSHMGWLMVKKHPYVIELGRKIDISDLKADPWVMWQYKHYNVLYFLLGMCFPVMVPVYFGESWLNSILFCGFFRYVLSLHLTWFINSIAHFYGTRPYDKSLRAVESSFSSFWTLGEGWHNYHHIFPWDYKASEYGMHFNLSASFIRCCATLGLASDLKTASPEMVRQRIIRTGDGTHHLFGNHIDDNNNDDTWNPMST